MKRKRAQEEGERYNCKSTKNVFLSRRRSTGRSGTNAEQKIKIRFTFVVFDSLRELLIICVMKDACESCLMPFAKDPGQRESNQYCSYCFKNGELCYKGNDLKEFQKVAYQNMRAHGTNPVLATFFAFMIRYAKRWKK